MIIGVTGSEGKIGRATVQRLRAGGHTVVGFDVAGPSNPGFTRIDLGDYGQVLDAFLGVTARHDGLDALVHLGAIPVNGLVPDVTTFENNVMASFHVLLAAHRAGIRTLVTASSITLSGFPYEVHPPFLPLDETHTAAYNTYALGKVAEEAMIAQLVGWAEGTSITALRFTNVVAEGEYDTFASADRPDYRRDLLGSWVDARDAALAVELALQHSAPGFEVYNVAHPLSGIASPSRDAAERWFPGVPVADDLGDYESLFSTRKIQARLGFTPEHDWR